MPPRPTHKRHPTSEDKTPHKKTRFLEPEDEPANFAENVDQSLEDHPSTRRKGQVKSEGYDSDSSDDGEGVVLSRRKGETQDEEEEDIFAMGDDNDKKKDSMDAAPKKETNYLNLGDIEGQEFANQSDGDSAEEDEPEDEDDAERRKKVGMGYELSSFNMREEMEEGKFTEDGSYIRSFDPHGIHDRWMDGLADKDIKKARRNHRKLEKEQQEKMLAEEKQLEESGGMAGLEKELLCLLKKGETVLEALQRLGKKAKKKKKEDAQAGSAESTKAVQANVDKITHLASNIMSLGDTDVYSKTYEELVRAVRRAKIVDESWQPPSADVQFEYKWDVRDSSGQPGQVFGPYSEDDMSRWFDALYFGSGGEKVRVRAVGGDWQSWDEAFS